MREPRKKGHPKNIIDLLEVNQVLEMFDLFLKSNSTKLRYYFAHVIEFKKTVYYTWRINAKNSVEIPAHIYKMLRNNIFYKDLL